MHNLTSTAGIVAIAAGAVAVVALALRSGWRSRCAACAPISGWCSASASEDLVAHAASLERQFAALTQYVEDAAARLNERMETAERRIDGAVAYRSLVRYDAYGEMSGRQSTSIALLDATASGIVLSSIHHRDQARLYAKQVREGTRSSSCRPRRTRRSGSRSRAAGRHRP